MQGWRHYGPAPRKRQPPRSSNGPKVGIAGPGSRDQAAPNKPMTAPWISKTPSQWPPSITVSDQRLP